MMLAAILAATLSWNDVATNKTPVVSSPYFPMVREEEPKTPVDQWHKFARGGKVKFQKDTRPKQYKSEEVEYKDRPPRKPQPKMSVKKGEKK